MLVENILQKLTHLRCMIKPSEGRAVTCGPVTSTPQTTCIAAPTRGEGAGGVCNTAQGGRHARLLKLFNHIRWLMAMLIPSITTALMRSRAPQRGGWGAQFSSAFIASILFLTQTPAHAQSIELVTETPDYQIMQVAASEVCFAVHNGTSAKDASITFATYKTKSGDRWQVAGFVDDTTITAKSDMLTIQFDDTPLITRGVEFSRGDFILPFTEAADLDAYDAQVTTAAEMTLQLRQTEDTITLDLNALRVARTQIETCLEGIK